VPPSRRALTGAPGDGRANCGSKPVTAADLGADQVAVITKHPAQRGDLNLQVCLRNNHARPNTAKDLVLVDQRSVGLQQDQKDVEGTRPQLDRCAVGKQLPAAQQHAEAANSNVASAATGFDQSLVIDE
jgi:hypothetical protein